MKLNSTACPMALLLVLACSREPRELKQGMEAF